MTNFIMTNGIMTNGISIGSNNFSDQSAPVTKTDPTDLSVTALVGSLIEDTDWEEAPGSITSPNLGLSGALERVEVIVVQHSESLIYDIWILGYEDIARPDCVSIKDFLLDPAFPKHFLNLSVPGLHYFTVPVVAIDADMETWPSVEYTTPRDQTAQMIAKYWAPSVPYAAEMHRVFMNYSLPYLQGKGRMRLFAMHSLPGGGPGAPRLDAILNSDMSTLLADRLHREIGVRLTMEANLALYNHS